MSNADERESHSIASAIRSAFLVWYAVLGGVAAWTIHLMFLASFVQFSCNAGYTWVMHAVTAGTAVMTLVAMALSLRLVRLGADPDDQASEASRTRFLGRLGLIVGTFNLALILAEESYGVFFHVGGRCGV